MMGPLGELTLLIFCLLRQDLEVQEPRLDPGQDEGEDGQQVAEGTLGEKLNHRNNFIYTFYPKEHNENQTSYL